MNHKKTCAVLDYDAFILFQTMVELTDNCNFWCKDVEFPLIENLSCQQIILLFYYTVILVQRYEIFAVENLPCRISPDLNQLFYYTVILVQRYGIFAVENLPCRISPGTPMISMVAVLHLFIAYRCELYHIKSPLLG